VGEQFRTELGRGSAPWLVTIAEDCIVSEVVCLEIECVAVGEQMREPFGDLYAIISFDTCIDVHSFFVVLFCC
jgi:hypothetical protein